MTDGHNRTFCQWQKVQKSGRNPTLLSLSNQAV